jgi:LacI family fructose operon transcriptional repressor
VSQAFTEEARARAQMPAIVSTRRKTDQEVDSVRGLIAYTVDSLMLVGTVDPASLSRICRKAKVPHVFVDQP